MFLLSSSLRRKKIGTFPELYIFVHRESSEWEDLSPSRGFFSSKFSQKHISLLPLVGLHETCLVIVTFQNHPRSCPSSGSVLAAPTHPYSNSCIQTLLHLTAGFICHRRFDRCLSKRTSQKQAGQNVGANFVCLKKPSKGQTLHFYSVYFFAKHTSLNFGGCSRLSPVDK